MNWETYKKTVKGTMFNATIMTLIFQQISYPLVKWRGNDFGPELPSLPTAVWNLFVCAVVVEIGFYYTHRYHVCTYTVRS